VQELITRAQADLIFTAGPLAVALVALAWWRLKRDPTGLAVGVASVLVGVMWRVFNAISDRMGIETLANLGVNGAVFFAVALGYGVWMRRVLPPIVEVGEPAPGAIPVSASAGDGSHSSEIDDAPAHADPPPTSGGVSA
jgi:hypothetical protein